MIYIYTILYGINLFFFIDTLLESPKYWLQIDISRIFLIIGAILYVYNLFIKQREKDLISKKYLIRKEIISFVALFPIFMLFLLNIGRDNTNGGVVLQQFLLVSNVFITAKVFSQYRRKDLFILMSFLFPALYLLYFYAAANFPTYNLLKLGDIFASIRIRNSFSFNNPNTAGNLSAGTIILSFIFIANVIKSKDKIYIKIIKIIMTLLLDIPLAFMLFNTGSRTSVVYLGIFIILMIYFVITNIKGIKLLYKIILKFLVVVIIILSLTNIFNVNEMIDLYELNRYSHIKDTLKDVKNSDKNKYGLGLIYVGDFPKEDLDFGIEPAQVDNYYAYIYLCMGQVGLTVFLICFIFIGILVYLNMYLNINIESSLIPAVFISYMIAGLGEACILYFTFPIGFIFTTLYVIVIDDLFYAISNKNLKLENTYK